MRSAVLFIDGQYLTHIERHYEVDVDYERLSKRIARALRVRAEAIRYYTAPPFHGNPPTESEQKRKAGYDRFVHALRKQNIIVREGRCQRIGTTYTQKGVDTLFTIDLIQMNHTHPNADTAVLLTADTDFVPAIEAAADKGINVVLVSCESRSRRSRLRVSNELLKACPQRLFLKRTMFEP